MKVLVKLKSENIRHGQSALSKASSKPALNKLSSYLKISDKESSQKVDGKKVKNPINYIRVPYLKNTASTRSHIVYEADYNESTFQILDKHYNAFLNLASFDFNQAKLDYKAKKAELNERMSSLCDDSVLPDHLAKEYQDELHKASFMCWRHQLKFIVYDDKFFEGASYDESRGIWSAATVSVSVYTLLPLTETELVYLSNGSDTINQPQALSYRVITRIREVVDGVVKYRPLRSDEDLDDFI